MRATALVELRQDFKTSEREAEQDFTAKENIADRDFTTKERVALQDFKSGEGIADRDSAERLARIRESGANSRAAQGNWETIRKTDGSVGRYNPETGEYRDTEITGNALLGDEGDLSDVEKKRFDLLSDDIDAIRERAAYEARDLTKDEVEILVGYINDRNAILGSGGSGEQTILEKLAAGEGGDTGGTGEGGSGGTDAPDLTYQQIMDGIQQESGQQSVSDVLSDVGLLVSEIKLSEGASSGGLIGPGPRGQGRAKEKGDKARAEAQKLLPTLVEMYNATKNEDERALLRKRIGELGEIGITPAKP